ncbi:MAG: hypothetical protein LUD81_07830, partial [Clostridiales bacterium]|nr:hypothetical protein [Clostridiales bacterium]
CISEINKSLNTDKITLADIYYKAALENLNKVYFGGSVKNVKNVFVGKKVAAETNNHQSDQTEIDRLKVNINKKNKDIKDVQMNYIKTKGYLEK